MPRIPTVSPSQAGLFVRFVYRIAKRQIGKLTGRAEVVEPLQLMAHHPRVLFGIGQMDLGIEGAKSVPDRYKQLALLRAAKVIECPF